MNLFHYKPNNSYKKLYFWSNRKLSLLSVKKILRTYRFALHPNREQRVLLARHFGCVRYVYNHFLQERITQYRIHKQSDNYHAQARALTVLKGQEETKWLKEVNSQSLQYALRCLDTAFKNFFRGRARFPRFKSKRHKNSFRVPQFVRLQEGQLHLPKFKTSIKVKVHRPINGQLKHCTVSRTSSGKYFVSLLCEEMYRPKEKTGAACGLDLGLKDLITSSEGTKYRNHRYTKKYAVALKRAQQHLSRKEKGSRSFERQKRKVARLHDKISNSRMDRLHNLSHELVSAYDLICVEDLHVKGMVKNRKLARHISDASWGALVRLLEYKADWNDKRVVKISRWYPSSKTCHECGWINEDLDLSVRVWTCGNGHQLDRDINAAVNILREGKRIISAGTVENTGGEKVRPRPRSGHISGKPEAHQSLAGG